MGIIFSEPLLESRLAAAHSTIELLDNQLTNLKAQKVLDDQEIYRLKEEIKDLKKNHELELERARGWW